MDANEFLMSGGAKAAAFPTIGTVVTGVVCGEPKVQQQTDPKDNSLKFFPSGDPMQVLVVPIQTDLRDSPDDDGKRTLWIAGKTVGLLRDAIRAAGGNGLEQGARITQTYVADGEKKPGLNPPKIYTVAYQRPAPGAAANAHLMGNGATAAPQIPPAPTGVDAAKWAAMSDQQRQAVTAVLGSPAMAGAAPAPY